MRVFVTGGTGLVGSRLVKKLLERGDQVTLLTRRLSVAKDLFGAGCTPVEGDPMMPGEWMKPLGDCDGVIHLAGENIFAKRWKEEFKALLFDSRIKSTQNIVQALAMQPKRPDGTPKVLVNASAIGYYGPRGDEELDETSSPGQDFLAHLCVEWEKAARAIEPVGVRLAMVRVGVVLDKKGGALKQMLTPFKLGMGGPVGNGKQYVSWIHHEDMTGLFLMALDNPLASGPINGTAPNPVTSKAFGKALGAALHRPAFMPTPVLMLRLAFGEVTNILATGQRVIPKKAMALGYAYKYPTVEIALSSIIAEP
jgi:uncharacterized protein (TIGR01777 family)